MHNFIAVVLQEIHSSGLLHKRCEILIALLATKSITTTEKQNKLQQITADYRSRVLFVFCLDAL